MEVLQLQKMMADNFMSAKAISLTATVDYFVRLAYTPFSG